MRERAEILIELCNIERLTLVHVIYPNDTIGCVSIIGHAISWGAVEVWKANEAKVEELETIIASWA